MEKRDYYQVLGVSRNASPDEIKKNYRQLALKFHPDRNPGDKEAEEKFKEASVAYQILSDAENRAKYDRFGHAAFDGRGYGDFSSFAEEIFGDIFGAFFGNAAGDRRQTGRDLRYQLEITLEEAANGVEKEIILPKPINCETCHGSGAKEGTGPERCKQCGGSGQIRIQQGFFTLSRTCHVCGGQGLVIVHPCEACHGSGQTSREVKLAVKVPAGIDSGQRLRIRGEGEPGPQGGQPGDLYVLITIAPHKTFLRREQNLFCDVPISYVQAVLGGEITIPTLNGQTNLKIPPGTPSEHVFKVRGKGIIDIHTGRKGDLHVRAIISVPTKTSDRQRALLQEYAQLEGEPVLGDTRSILERMKDFFE